MPFFEVIFTGFEFLAALTILFAIGMIGVKLLGMLGNVLFGGDFK